MSEHRGRPQRRTASVASIARIARAVDRRARLAVGLDRVRYRGVTLPPRERRRCGPRFGDDEVFLNSAVAEAMRLEHHFGLTRAGTVLDVGCGVGRLAIGLLVRLGELAAYRGFDVDRSDVEWCSRHIGRHHPGFAFFHVDMANARYNPEGEPVRADTRLPFADESFDAVYANSVFTHMEAGDVRVYLREIGRMLRRDGGAFVTAFVEPDVPDVAVNPPDYMDRWSGPLHCVRYESGYFEYMIEDAGLRIDRFDHRAFTVGQSAFYLSKRT